MIIEFDKNSRLEVYYPASESKYNGIEFIIRMNDDDDNCRDSDITLIIPEQLASDIFEALRKEVG